MTNTGSVASLVLSLADIAPASAFLSRYFIEGLVIGLDADMAADGLFALRLFAPGVGGADLLSFVGSVACEQFGSASCSEPVAVSDVPF
ncbi:MAG: hypothetical protein WC054_01445 [Candidatus Nanopelagicales bacterium]